MKMLIVKQIVEDWKVRPQVLLIELFSMVLNLLTMLAFSVMGNDAPAEIILGLFTVGSLGFMYATYSRNLIVPFIMSCSYFLIELIGFIKAIL